MDNNFHQKTSGNRTAKSLLALLAVKPQAEVQLQGPDEPANIIQHKLLALWKEVLNRESIGIRDNFFKLGGESLKMIQLISRISKVFDTELSIAEVFKHLTIESQSALIAKREIKTATDILPVALHEYYDVSHAQKRLWLLSKFKETQKAYVIPVFYEISGQVDVEALSRSFDTLVIRHESLRTVFITVDGEPKQKILSPSESKFNLLFKDLRAQAKDEAHVLEMLCHDAHVDYDLEKGPFLRASLVQLEDAKYILMVSMHHIVSDGWSIEIIVGELLACYNAYRNGQKNPLAAMTIQYKDYAHWQNLHLTGAQLASHRQFWMDQFSATIPVLDLPTDYARSSVKTYHGNRLTFWLDASVSKGLQQLSDDNGATLFMTLFAVIKTLLYRYTGQHDLIMGTPVSGRDHRMLEDQIGFYINVLALRTRLQGEWGFIKLLNNIKENILQAYGHQVYPFDLLIQELNLERDRSRSPLYDTGFTWHGNASQQLQVDNITTGFEVKILDIDTNVSKADLWLHGTKDGNEVKLVVEYNTDLFCKESMQRLIDHFNNLVQAILGDPAASLDTFEFLSENERVTILDTFNNTTAQYPSASTIQDLFESQAARTPSAIAVCYDNTRLSYFDLNSQSNRLAHFLRATYNLKTDEIIGVMMERSENLIIALLGILKAGGAYLPIDPATPRERVNHIVTETQLKVLLTTSDLIFSLTEYFHGELFAIDIQLSSLDGPKTNPHKINKPTDLAYVIYTSGSTGTPKGVMIEHCSNVNMSLDQIRKFGVTPEDNILQFASISFDASISEIFMALYAGATLTIIDDKSIQEANAFVRFIEKHRITVATLIPSYLSIVDPDGLRSLRVLITAGEAASVRDAYQYSQFLEYYNAYGPTEYSVCVSIHCVAPGISTGRSVPIGKPIANTSVYILDQNMKPVPMLVCGELCVSGMGLSRGYINQPQLTLEKFIDHPYKQNETLYKTGDRARWLPDGSIEFIGRVDSQLKIAGHRIEPAEIEAIINGNEQIQACIVAAKNVNDDKVLVAYYIRKIENNDGIVKELSWDFLSNYLPGYMIPSYFIAIEKFPITVNGKVDHSALPLPSEWLSPSTLYTAPRNNREKQIAMVWNAALHRDQTGVYDNYFSLGGDSIKAIRLVSQINKVLNTHLEVGDIFNNPTIASLDLYIGETDDFKRRETEIDEAKNFVEELKRSIIADSIRSSKLPENYEDFYPLSDIQKGMLYYTLLDSESGVYHDQMYSEIIEESFSMVCFEQAVKLISVKHTILRTSFNLYDFEIPIQIVHSAEDCESEIEFTDISGITPADQKRFIETYLQKDKSNSFRIDKAGLWRFRIFKLNDNEYGILFVTHHAIIDGWSDASFFTELSELYFAIKENPAHKPTSLKASYKDYVIDQQRIKHSKELKAYWRRTLPGYERTSLPFHKAISNDANVVSKFYDIDIDEQLNNEILKLSAETGISVKNILLTAFLYLIKVTTNSDEITIGLVANGRPDVEDGDKVLGCFLNTIPFRILNVQNLTKIQWLNKVNELSNEVKSYDRLSLLELVAEMNEEHGKSNPFFDVVFNFTDFHVFENMHENTRIKPSDIKNYARTNLPFNLSVWAYGKKLKFGITYHQTEGNGYSADELERLGGYFVNIISQLCEPVQEAFNVTRILGKKEIQKILFELNNTEIDHSNKRNLIEWFEQQAMQTPLAVAVVDETTSLSYQELNEQANRLAHYLRNTYNIKPNDTIGLMMEKSVGVVVGLVGILKSGAAYVPVDPEFPDERVQFILADSDVKVVLTETQYYSQLSGNFPCILVDNNKTIKGCPFHNLPIINSSDDLMYLIYTSGSTGKPKAVMIEHRAFVNVVFDQINRYGITAKDCVHQFVSLSFDVSLLDIFHALLCGASLSIPKRSTIKDSHLFTKFLQDHRITVATLTPSFLSVLDLDELRKLKVLILGGEVPNVSDAVYCSSFLKCFNAYGPTEATISTCVYQVTDKDKLKSKIPIGTPISNVSVYVLNSLQEPVPIGVIGEIYIGGLGLARGYWKNNNLTSEKFIGSPFDPNARLYRTGDLGKWTEEGVMDFVMRKDSQVKVRGYRIELSEIESALLKLPVVTGAVVMTIESDNHQKVLIAYYTGPIAEPAEKIKTWLRKWLPDYMVPSYLIHLAEFPLTLNGKVDYKSLTAPDLSENVLTYVAPRNETEDHLARIWSEVLERKGVSINDNFFELGGHSLKAMQVVSRIYKELNYEIALNVLFSHPTIAELASLVKHKQKKIYSGILPVKEQSHYGLSHAQRRLWILSQFEEGRVAYNTPGAYVLEGLLDRHVLENSFAELIRRHESLRTTFITIEGEPRQKINDYNNLVFEMRYFDLCAHPDKDRQVQIVSQQDIALPFDLTHGPLLRVTLFQLEEEKHILIFILHHIISDGWSMEVISSEVQSLYYANISGTSSTLPPLHVQYKDYTAWKQAQLQDELLDHQTYALQEFGEGVSKLMFPLDFPRPKIRSNKGSHISARINEDVSKRLYQLSCEQGCSLYMTLLSGFYALLHCYTDQEDIIVGTVDAGRQHIDLENQIGFYVNTIPFRVQFSGEDSFVDLIDKVKIKVFRAYEHLSYPFDELLNYLNLGRDRSRSPLFDVVLSLRNTHGVASEVNALENILKISPFKTEVTSSTFDLIVDVADVDGTLALSCFFNTDIFKKESIQLLMDHFIAVLSTMTANPDHKINSISLMDRSEPTDKAFDKSFDYEFDFN